jgi:tRNA/rRNA methyltransferase
MATKKHVMRERRRARLPVKPGTPKHQAKPVQRGRQRFRIVLVEPEIPGNIGFVARVMANFGVEELVLVGGCEITDESRDRAVHAQHILDRSRRVSTLAEAFKGTQVIVGSTAVLAVPDASLHRNPVALGDAISKIQRAGKRVALVFGRESRGLLNDELEQIDLLVTIPTNDAYPSLNVSHALAIVLYELSGAVRRIPLPELATRSEREALLDRFDDLMAAGGLPDWRIQRNRVTLRRLLARAGLSKWEFHSTSGIASRAMKAIERERAKSARK